MENVSITMLNRQRGSLKAKVKNLETFLEGFIKTKESIFEVELKLSNCDNIIKNVEDLRLQYYKQPETAELSEPEKELESLESRLDKLKVRFKILLNKELITDSNVHANVSKVKDSKTELIEIKLPSIPLPEFYGKYEHWSTFKEQFNNLISSNNNLNDMQKLYYLKSTLKGQSKLIETEDDTFQSLFNALTQRFENKRLIIDTHVNAILNCENMHADSPKELRSLVDNVRKNLRALKVLEYDRNNLSDIVFVNILMQKLDRETKKQFEISLGNTEVPKLDEFLDFLEKRSSILESINRNVKCSKTFLPPNKVKSFIINSKDNLKCLYCKGPHYIFKCVSFLNIDVTQRLEFARQNRLCMNCLNNCHTTFQCKSKFTCLRCKRKHHSLLHTEQIYPTRRESNSFQTEFIQNKQSVNSPSEEQINHAINSPPLQSLSNILKSNSTVLLSTADIYVYSGSGETHKLRAILDCASQINLMTSECADLLRLKRTKVYAPVSGINETISTIKSKVFASICNEDSTFKQELEFLVVKKITDLTPPNVLDVSELPFPKGIKLADINFSRPNKIHLLIGAELFFKILRYQKIQINENIILQDTVFGYLVTGRLPCTQHLRHCFLTTEETNLEKNIARFWEIESVHESVTKQSEDELFCESHYKKTTYRDKSGQYVVQMPLKEDPEVLGKSREMAWRRLNSNWNRLLKNPDLSDLYKDFMYEYENLNHLEKVNEEYEPDTTYYIPHHSIYRPEKRTTKLRVVFDASAPSSNGTSLNSIQVNGGVVQEDIFAIMSRFRTHPIALTGDVKKMYRMIWIDPSQRDMQRILWKNNSNDPVKIYRLRTLTYGTTSAPFLATRTLKQLSIDEGSKYPLAASVVAADFYIDDLVSGAPNIEYALNLQSQLIELFKSAGMELHKWSSNHKCILKNVPSENNEYSFDKNENSIKTLGVTWNPEKDIFGFSLEPTSLELVTKRSVLSEISRIFDPLGLLGPVIVKAKIFMQRLWLLKIDWDQPLPEKEKREWSKFSQSLQAIKHVKVNRYILSENNSRVELHGYSDASRDAYGASIYLRCVTSSGEITTNLMCSKSRVTPIKTVSIPRLELCAAELLSKLVKKVLSSLKIEICAIHLFTDSTIVLGWLKTSPHMLKTFVANRVSKIQQLTSSYNWHHIKSEINPSDLISRGFSPEKISNCSLWWHGPPTPQPDTPDEHSMSNDCDILKEHSLANNSEFFDELKKDYVSLNLKINDNFLDNLFEITNNFSKLISILSYIYRFMRNSRGIIKNSGPLKKEELIKAQTSLIKLIQVKYFPTEIRRLKRGESVPSDSKLKCLSPFLDKTSLIRVGGRLKNSDLPFDQKYPIIIPKEGKLTKLIFEHFHRKNLHAGPQTLLYAVRQEFWPINGRDIARKIVNNCITCYKQNPKVSEQIMGNLPAERVTPTFPFNVSGVDFCGPFNIKSSGQRKAKLIKIYLAIFVCFVTKAIHIEIVTDLTSAAFIACLKRFFARRGKSAVIFSDNAKNFVGANAEIKRMHKLLIRPNDQLENYFASEQIAWKFIPPRTPNFGGLWEAGVKSVKYYLRRVVANANLTYEEYLTVINQVEAVLNSRPIAPLSSNPDDLQALTPGHFLIGRPLNALPEPVLLEVANNRLSRWQLTTKLVQSIWARWKKDYLNNLQQKNKLFIGKQNLTPNMMVLVKEDSFPPTKWKIGRIVEIFSGSDGRVRVVEIKTSSGVIKRGIANIAVLPM